MIELTNEQINQLVYLGIISPTSDDTRDYNVGKSDYSKHTVQPWTIWLDYNLNPWDADIVKRVLRTKEDTPRIEDYEKIIHICKERIRQLKHQNGLETEKVVLNYSKPIEFQEII